MQMYGRELKVSIYEPCRRILITGLPGSKNLKEVEEKFSKKTGKW